MKTDILSLNLLSPDKIRETSNALLREKQGNLENAFGFLIAGIVLAFVMVIFRFHF